MQPQPGKNAALVGWLSGVAIALGAFVVALPHPVDDAGFFFRYAAHLGAGDGFTFNPGGEPTLGVSSLLWCGLLGVMAGLGVAPEEAHLPLGIVLTGLAGGWLCWASAKRFGGWAGVGVCFALLSNGRFLIWASAGMETSLGFLLVALGLAWALTERLTPLRAGVCAGLCVLHKLDLGAFALGLLWVARKPGEARSWRGVGVALGIAAAIVGVYALWAWQRFGSPLPLSVARKLGRDHGAVETFWFVREALFADAGPWYCALALVGIAKLGWRSPVVCLAVLHIASHVAAYSLRPPAEPYGWYSVQLQPSLMLLAGCGLYAIAAAGTGRLKNPKWAARALFAFLLVAGVALWNESKSYRRGQHAWSHQVEAHRIAAGRWLASHTPKDARVATGFGLPAYFSERHIHDWSGLTQALPNDPSFYQATDPDFIATCEFQGATRESYEPPTGYEVLQFFGSKKLPGDSEDFFMVVLGRAK